MNRKPLLRSLGILALSSPFLSLPASADAGGRRSPPVSAARKRKSGAGAAIRVAGLLLALGVGPWAAAAGHELYRDDFAGDLRQWIVEQMPGGAVTTHDGALDIETARGCTVWFRTPLDAPVRISYEVTPLPRVVASDQPAFRSEAASGPLSPVTDVNCFWMARDLRSPADLFAPGLKRTGLLSDYDILLTYYVGFGSNNNTTTRFRRYAGDGTRPLLPAYDRRDSRFLLTPSHPYHITLVAQNGVAEFWRDGERIFAFPDSAPLTRGWFGFRTVRSHLLIRHFVVETP